MKNFRTFVGKWVRYGFEKSTEDQKFVTGWRMGHDWNSEYGILKYKKEIEPLNHEIHNAIQVIVGGVLINPDVNEYQIDSLAKWLEADTMTVPHGVGGEAVKYAAFGIYYLLKLQSELNNEEI